MILSCKKIIIILVIGICGLCFAAPVSADSIGYGDYYGTTVDFLGVTEESTTDSLPLYGAPILVDNQSLFFPTTFSSSSR